MSTEKSRKPRIDVKAALKQLKALHVPGVAGYDARKTLTNSQKRTIKRNYEKYHSIASAPRSEYIIKDISKLESQAKTLLKNADYKIIGNKLYVDKQGFERANLKVKEYTNEKGEKIKAVKVQRKKTGTRSETEYLVKSDKVTDLQEMFLRQYEAGNFKKGDFVGLKIGNGGRFHRVIMHNVNDIYKYVRDDFEPHDRGTTKEYLTNKMRLVKISAQDHRDLKFNERTQKDKNKLKRQRAKKSVVAKPKNKFVGKVSKTSRSKK